MPPMAVRQLTFYNNRTTTIKQGNEKLEVQTGNRDVIIDKGDDTHLVSEGNAKSRSVRG